MYAVQSVSVRKVTVYGAVKTNECVHRASGQTTAAAAGGAIFGDFRRFVWGPAIQIFVWGPGIVKWVSGPRRLALYQRP